MHTRTAEHNDYRIDHPTMADVLRDMHIPKTDPGPGDRVPDFDLPTTDGGRFSSDSLAADGRPVLLVFGSLTCPVTESAGEGLRELHARYGSAVRFVMVDVREAHPGSINAQPSSMHEKAAHAGALKEHHSFSFEMAIDDLEGTMHRAFGPRPSSAYLVDPSGTILFRAQWSNVTDALDEALAAVTAGQTPPHPAVRHTLRSMTAMTGHADVAFAAAGDGALRDTWKAAPPFGAMIVLSRMFGFLPRSKRGLPAIAAMMAIGLAVVAAALTVL